MKDSVIDNPAQHRFELPVGDAIAVAAYRMQGEMTILVHTEVPQELSGQGIGSKLATGVFESIRDSRRKVVTECPFMAAWVSRHPEYSDLVVG
ncbi:GNAT family N-acetyltransferase [Microvirga aerophila]|uniref:N-acetyltransferase n=1 Tax=Microvirga aerophila TaxID=670291 RepID=A0A512BLM1_9HYPH|nr:GNAT family N-acetyltransferase [Microvirga aerophila]GEO12864.1 N-acetyltransferase [Microvirga aerophila]